MQWDHFQWDAPETPLLLKKRKPINRRTMASNPTPDNNDILRALADRIADGCHTHEVSLGIKQNMESVIRAAILGLETAESDVGTKKLAVSSAYDGVQAADEAGKTLLTNCKLRLAQKLGQRWSASWEPTGFPGQSTAVPNAQDARFTLLKDLVKYFTDNAANESVDMGATAALCQAAWTALSDARQAVSNAESAQTTAFTARAAAADTLRRRVRGLIGELETLIPDDDARYEAFGLNIPANPSAPETVATVTLTALGSGRVGVAWTYAVRSTRVGLEAKIVGVDADFVSKGSFKDLETILKGFAAGQTVQVRATAKNDGGDAAPSPVASVLVT